MKWLISFGSFRDGDGNTAIRMGLRSWRASSTHTSSGGSEIATMRESSDEARSRRALELSSAWRKSNPLAPPPSTV